MKRRQSASAVQLAKDRNRKFYAQYGSENADQDQKVRLAQVKKVTSHSPSPQTCTVFCVVLHTVTFAPKRDPFWQHPAMDLRAAMLTSPNTGDAAPAQWRNAGPGKGWILQG